MTKEVTTTGYYIQPDKYSWAVVRAYVNKKGKESRVAISWHKHVGDAAVHLFDHILREKLSDAEIDYQGAKVLQYSVKEAKLEILDVVKNMYSL